jgi:hypothetical protein
VLDWCFALGAVERPGRSRSRRRLRDYPRYRHYGEGGPNSYILLVVGSSVSISPFSHKKQPFDPHRAGRVHMPETTKNPISEEERDEP